MFDDHIARAGLTAALLGALLGCAVNPATGERQLSLISESQEVALGRESAGQVEQTLTMVDDPSLQEYVSSLGQKLAAGSERPELPWSFRVVDDAAPNAFALPGGFIYVTRGMMTLMENEAELATVLGHEIAHVTARHSVAQISRAQLAQLGFGLGMILVPELRPFGDVAGLGMNLLMLKYGRDAEREADELGFGYARQQHYDVSEMADVFASLGRMADMAGQSALPAWLATHPAPEERVRAARERLAGAGHGAPDAVVGREQYLERIDGLAYGANPRNGFFRDGTFYHPELAFRFTVPADWQTRNLAQAVLARSPQGDAALQLTLSDAGDPDQGLRRFLSQQGVRAAGASDRPVNGLDAATGIFQAQSQQTPVAGYAAFIAHGGRVYQLVLYTPAQAFAGNRARFEEVIGSFGILEDPEILTIEAPVVEIVRTEEAMTLAEFHRRFPSAVSVEQLAILNQLDGPDAPIAAGTLVKRVVGDPELLDTAARGAAFDTRRGSS